MSFGAKDQERQEGKVPVYTKRILIPTTRNCSGKRMKTALPQFREEDDKAASVQMKERPLVSPPTI